MLGFFASLLMVFVAELGDKTQLLVLSLTAKYKVWKVLLGIGISIVLLQLLAALLGKGVSGLIPDSYLKFFVGILFLGFGVWSLKAGGDEEKAEEHKNRNAFVVVSLIALTFFVAELGDKTQLATFSLAVKYQSFLPVWSGSAAGLFLADALAVLVGLYLGKKMPVQKITYISAGIFILFGLVSLVQSFI